MATMTALIAGILLYAQLAVAANLTSLVNLFIGTASGANGGSGGNVFPGSTLPMPHSIRRYSRPPS
jgi:hypothetical protein